MKCTTASTLAFILLSGFAASALAQTTTIGKDVALKNKWDAKFQKLDTNKDGFLSKEEWWAEERSGFDSIDTNKDGKISAEEVKQAASAKPTESFEDAAFAAMFPYVMPSMDTNKDGSLSQEEIQAYKDKEFATSDANHDGKLDVKEYACHGKLEGCYIGD